MRKNLESKNKLDAYKTWALRKFITLLIMAVVFFVAMHIMARADMALAADLDLIGKLFLNKDKEEKPEAAAPAGDEGGDAAEDPEGDGSAE